MKLGGPTPSPPLPPRDRHGESTEPRRGRVLESSQATLSPAPRNGRCFVLRQWGLLHLLWWLSGGVTIATGMSSAGSRC